ncbi:hypothetical protein [Streptomyces sp. MZ04]|uniref:hypothetical protein n=1 Tax=Streptomyces sp. MZ04 TaxID=2559236 RepID=UPI001FD833A3|nr:hypothetical protein [Streptomyces sp. MZ04]
MTSGNAPYVPGPAGTRIVAAGVDWDAIKVVRSFGLQALDRIAEPGAVVVDPSAAAPAVYFFVRPGTTDGWNVAQSTALSVTNHVTLPPESRVMPPGPYWLTSPADGRLHTDTATVRAALERVTGSRPSWNPRMEHFT